MGESIERTLGRIETKLDACLKEQALDPERRKLIYTRLEVVEKWQARLITAGVVIAGLVGVSYKVLLDVAQLAHR